MRAIIRDELFERNLYTRKCSNEEEARTEAQEAIKRLCKKNKIEVNDSRFVLEGFEIN